MDGLIQDGASATPSRPTVTTRGYQREMLEESLRRNIIIAMDTGSGKTHVAVLRLKIETERESRKISWFFAPTVSLCEQQHRVISEALPVSVGLITGAKHPDQWKDTNMWQTVLRDYRVVVSTPQVLLDALRHGYIVMGRDLSLLIFDEAHHAVEGDPYNRIMQEFYRSLPPRIRRPDGSIPDFVQPMIMGLTASPIYGGNVDRAFNVIQQNLDSTIVSPRQHRDELTQFVHRPVFKHVLYRGPDYGTFFSPNVAALKQAIETLDIEDDPYVKSLRQSLAQASHGSAEYRRIDGRLSKVISKEDSFTHKGLRDCHRTAEVILGDVGYWAAEWFVWEVLDNAKKAANPLAHMMKTWKVQEKVYLLEIINRILITRPSYAPEDVAQGLSDKVVALIECLITEKEEAEKQNEVFSGLVFVQRRDVVLALKEVLSNHPVIAGAFRVGSLLGTSDSGHRHAMMDITRQMVKDSADEVLMDFRIGEKNLIVSTSVAEEGIDVQACGCVIRWDLPPNMASWAQSRGRARKRRSTFTLMFEESSNFRQDLSKWQSLEQEMVNRYTSSMMDSHVLPDGPPDDDGLRFEVEKTGALLTLQSAIPHLAHFCAVMSSRNLADSRPIYDLDPPDYPLDWHLFNPQFQQNIPLYQGPWNSTVVLPRVLPNHLRTFATDRAYRNKISAHQHAAYKAYLCLYQEGLLNDNLLPRFIDDDEVKEIKQEIEKRIGLVDVQTQIDPWTSTNGSTGWYRSELQIGDLPSLFILTRTEPPPWSMGDGPILHLPARKQLQVQLRRVDTIGAEGEIVSKARDYTRMILWSIHGSRMEWDKEDFSYLVLPAGEPRDDVWIERRSWLQSVDPHAPVKDAFHANAQAVAQHYDYPPDLVMIKRGSKPYRFIRWRFASEPLTTEEEEAVRNMYRKTDLEITYPLLVVEPYPPRTNFLVPIPPSTKPTAPPKQLLLVPALSQVPLYSETELDYALLLPSVLRALAMALTVESLREVLFSMTPMYDISKELLTVAITAPVSQERRNYQRLETLGDAVLKYVAAIQLFDEYPVWPEGYLTRRKDHIVNNAQLAKQSLNRETYKWIIRDRLIGKKWKPAYLSSPPLPPPPPAVPPPVQGPVPPTSMAVPRRKSKKRQQEMSTKVLADVIESLVGAAYEYGGIDMAYETMKFFDLGLDSKWKPLDIRVASILSRVDESELRVPELPPQVNQVERIIGYTFKRKILLVEALTHASHQQDFGTISYERMEFLGDAVLDMIVNDYLYFAPGKEYSPGHVYLRKVAVVNGHILAFMCLHASLEVDAQMPEPDEDGAIAFALDRKTIYLWQCLLHSSTHVHEEQRVTRARYRKRGEEIDSALKTGKIFPWASLTRLQAPKFYADMIESILGAVYLDSGGSLDAVKDVMRNLGLMQVLERIVNEDVDILHPASRLSMWAAQNQKKARYEYVRESGNITCNIYIDDELLEGASESDVYHGKPSQEEVRLAAAEAAIRILHLRSNGEA